MFLIDLLDEFKLSPIQDAGGNYAIDLNVDKGNFITQPSNEESRPLVKVVWDGDDAAWTPGSGQPLYDWYQSQIAKDPKQEFTVRTGLIR